MDALLDSNPLQMVLVPALHGFRLLARRKKPPSVVADAVMPLTWVRINSDPTSEPSMDATVNNLARPKQT